MNTPSRKDQILRQYEYSIAIEFAGNYSDAVDWERR